MSTTTASAQSEAKAQRAALTAEIVKLLEAHDSFVAIERIEDNADGQVIAQRYGDLVVDLYSQKKVAEMAAIGRVGLHYLLTQAKSLDGKDDTAAAWFKTQAQRMSFNLASNLWPGWGDAGIIITPELQAMGYDMARLDLRLVEELQFPPDKLCTGNWIVGVHHLAARRYPEALATLKKAKQHAEASGAKDTPLMVEGFIAITEIMEGKQADAARFRLAETGMALEKLGTDDARFYAQQHQAVLKVLSGR